MLQPTYKPFATLILIPIMIAIFILEIFIPSIITYFSFTPNYALEEPWTFVTSIFLHFDMRHIFFNMLALFMFGIVLESKIGHGKFLLIFFLSGIIGNVGYMMTTSDPNIPAIGASGAVYGIMGAAAIVMPFALVFVSIPIPMIAAAFLWGISEFSGLFVPSNIAHGAHLAGLFIGVIYGLYLRKIVK